ncbi:hypothetical protein HALLA_03785 (plasmid) [Halostagnicola larsenii XH-48]|uniref:Uncharacterized protein n=1 Tax=Halostagnicola larsenii XH-48 TaxID=797299 RepID=W0JSD9_9EURY|nr:hypothetical protein [Halostagnicola larsenii]AHG01524.1 hypothetical protein HALLA_03785 [Halostagnicola larsenii XH-48]
MTNDSTDNFQPTDAVQALSEIEGYSETLTARAFGLTLMTFAFAIAGIPISYSVADPWLASHEYGSYLLTILWLPWIAGAVIHTLIIWSTHSITLGEDPNSGAGGALGFGLTVLYFLISAGVYTVLGSTTISPIIMGISGGIFTIFLGLIFYILYRADWVLLPLIAAGVFIIIANLLLRTISITEIGAGFSTGFIQGATYFITGWVMVLRG